MKDSGWIEHFLASIVRRNIQLVAKMSDETKKTSHVKLLAQKIWISDENKELVADLCDEKSIFDARWHATKVTFSSQPPWFVQPDHWWDVGGTLVRLKSLFVATFVRLNSLKRRKPFKKPKTSLFRHFFVFHFFSFFEQRGSARRLGDDVGLSENAIVAGIGFGEGRKTSQSTWVSWFALHFIVFCFVFFPKPFSCIFVFFHRPWRSVLPLFFYIRGTTVGECREALVGFILRTFWLISFFFTFTLIFLYFFTLLDYLGDHFYSWDSL